MNKINATDKQQLTVRTTFIVFIVKLDEDVKLLKRSEDVL